MQLTTLH